MNEARLETVEEKLGLRLPEALREYYIVAGNTKINRVYNRLTKPEDLVLSKGYMVFYVENQGVASWSFKLPLEDAIDPLVYSGDPEPTNLESKISDFLVTMAYFQATMGGLKFPEGGIGLYTDIPEGVEYIKKKYRLLHDDGNYQVYGQKGLVMFFSGNNYVAIAAAKETSLINTSKIPGITYD